ncbi:hypothetical protein RUM43_011745 [Polyplax serrata]|uniref:Uncharacterized protein n=1 Tax=Polyplax serrata TaxID=468196 RepID=A0AAN8Q3B2_POLSC
MTFDRRRPAVRRKFNLRLGTAPGEGEGGGRGDEARHGKHENVNPTGKQPPDPREKKAKMIQLPVLIARYPSKNRSNFLSIVTEGRQGNGGGVGGGWEKGKRSTWEENNRQLPGDEDDKSSHNRTRGPDRKDKISDAVPFHNRWLRKLKTHEKKKHGESAESAKVRGTRNDS